MFSAVLEQEHKQRQQGAGQCCEGAGRAAGGRVAAVPSCHSYLSVVVLPQQHLQQRQVRIRSVCCNGDLSVF